MKTPFIFLFFAVIITILLTISTESRAQANWEIGMRFGHEISADLTLPLAAAPRLHPSVYFDRFGIGTYFDWMFAFSGGPTGLKIYPGVGPEFWFGNDFDFDVAGNFGIEYSFDFPLTIGFDWRPGFRLTDSFRWKSSNWGFMARFRIGEGGKIVKAH